MFRAYDRQQGKKQFETFSRYSSCLIMRSLVYIIVVVLIISWLLGGFAFHVGGDAIHIIIVIAVILLLFNLFGNHSDSYRRRWW
jgi:hypothetical protein